MEEEEEVGVVPGMSRRRTRGRPFGQLKKSEGGGRNARLEWRKRRRLWNWGGGGVLGRRRRKLRRNPALFTQLEFALGRPCSRAQCGTRSMCEHGCSYPPLYCTRRGRVKRRWNERRRRGPFLFFPSYSPFVLPLRLPFSFALAPFSRRGGEKEKRRGH